jgi:diguanylate cyclase (GGDEF)-like protein
VNNKSSNIINEVNLDAATAFNRNGLWVALLIMLLGIVLFSLISNSSGQGEGPLINKKAKLHIASTDTDDIHKIMYLADSEWESIEHSNFGISPKPHWFMVQIPSNAATDRRLIEVSFANLDFVDIWFVDKTHEQPVILSQSKSGDDFAFMHREIAHDQFIFAIPDSASTLSLFLRVETQGVINVPIKLWTEKEYIQYIASHRVFIGIFYGFMAAMALLNLFLFVTSRNIITLLYAGYVICVAVTLASSQGIAYRFLWPESILFQQYSTPFFASSMVFFLSHFTAKLLDIKSDFYPLYNLYRAIRIVIVVYIFCMFILPFSAMVTILVPMVLMVMFVIFSSTIYIAFKGNSIAKYLIAAWCSLSLSSFFVLADSLGWISVKLDLTYLMMVGATMETLLMALGLAMRFNAQRIAAKQAHIKARENKQKAMQAKKELMRLQIETKERLEYAVDARTYELEIAIRELNEANHELERKSAIDALTGVANRRLYDKSVLAEARRSRREKTPLAIAMLDIDDFKSVNDTYGHQCGDEALKHFTAILKECIKRPSDTICRYGGEEFVVILPNTDLEGAALLMESVRAMTEASQLNCEGEMIKFTVSIGVATRVISSDSESELLNAFADKLLYKAKEAGRNRVMSGVF